MELAQQRSAGSRRSPVIASASRRRLRRTVSRGSSAVNPRFSSPPGAVRSAAVRSSAHTGHPAAGAESVPEPGEIRCQPAPAANWHAIRGAAMGRGREAAEALPAAARPIEPARRRRSAVCRVGLLHRPAVEKRASIALVLSRETGFLAGRRRPHLNSILAG